MVFRHSSTKASLPYGIRILDLPEELLGVIISLDHLSREDILHARLAHPYFTPTCSSALQKQLRCLYLHPSARAIKAALNICAHPVFSRKIEEVILLGRIDWQEIQTHYSHVARDTSSFWDAWTGQRTCCAWPLNLIAASTSAIPTSQDPVIGAVCEALGRLPKLQRLCFAEGVTTPGFNQVTESVIVSTAKKTALPTSRLATSRYARQFGSFADMHVLMGILCHPNLRVRHLCLSKEMPYAFNHVLPPLSGSDWAPPHLSQAALGLISIELHFDQGWIGTKWQVYCAQMLEHAYNLEDIRLVWKCNPAIKSAVCEYTLSGLLQRHTWQALRSLELTFDSALPKTDRKARPLCQQFDLVDFLGRHTGTLRRFSVSNLVFATFACTHDVAIESLSKQSAHDTTRSVLTALSNCAAVEAVSFFIDRYRHDARCKKPEDRAWTLSWIDCKWECGSYCRPGKYGFVQTPLTMVDDFEALAKDLEVNLDEEMNGWDFSGWVRKTKETSRMTGPSTMYTDS